MDVNILNLERTIDKIVEKLLEIKVNNRNDNYIRNIKIEIDKYWMDDYYDTKFKIDYNIESYWLNEIKMDRFTTWIFE